MLSWVELQTTVSLSMRVFPHFWWFHVKMWPEIWYSVSFRVFHGAVPEALRSAPSAQVNWIVVRFCSLISFEYLYLII